jgi:hypothetical protein
MPLEILDMAAASLFRPNFAPSPPDFFEELADYLEGW